MTTTQTNELLQQLGGMARFSMMTGAKNFLRDESKNSLRFNIGRNEKGVNLVTIALDASDTYTMTFANYRALKVTVKATVSGVYCDMLREVFESNTGLYTSLGTQGR